MSATSDDVLGTGALGRSAPAKSLWLRRLSIVLLDGLLGHLDGRRRLFGSTTTLASISEEQALERTQEHEDWVGTTASF
jgi:hypothetical protein